MIMSQNHPDIDPFHRNFMSTFLAKLVKKMSQKSSGLFHRAIAQSGSLKTSFLTFREISKNPVYPFLRNKYEAETNEALKQKLSSLSTDELGDLLMELYGNPIMQSCVLGKCLPLVIIIIIVTHSYPIVDYFRFPHQL